MFRGISIKRLDQGIRRKLIQFAAFGFTNSHLPNFISGDLYTGKWKEFCAPGLNCYSCPAASFACPIGALQAVIGDRKFNMSFYVVGILLAFGVLFGRAVCAFLCPFGLLQELIFKIPRIGKKKEEAKGLAVPSLLRYSKYIILAVFVVYMPLFVTTLGTGAPAFCKYICPAGTLEGGVPAVITQPYIRAAVGALFSWKVFVLLTVTTGSLVVYRFFCKLMCPLGAIYGILNKVSIYRLSIDDGRCIGCGACARSCRMGVDPVASPDSAECIRCGECAAACPVSAIRIGFRIGADEYYCSETTPCERKEEGR